jgi:hypothetical protein
MLAQNFKTAEELRISPNEQHALIRVLGMFERGDVPPEMFRMNTIGAPECGTPGCILGWARTIDASVFKGHPWNDDVCRLFVRPPSLQVGPGTPTQAATALRNYLTTGEPSWAEAVRVD